MGFCGAPIEHAQAFQFHQTYGNLNFWVNRTELICCINIAPSRPYTPPHSLLLALFKVMPILFIHYYYEYIIWIRPNNRETISVANPLLKFTHCFTDRFSLAIVFWIMSRWYGIGTHVKEEKRRWQWRRKRYNGKLLVIIPHHIVPGRRTDPTHKTWSAEGNHTMLYTNNFSQAIHIVLQVLLAGGGRLMLNSPAPKPLLCVCRTEHTVHCYYSSCIRNVLGYPIQ